MIRTPAQLVESLLEGSRIHEIALAPEFGGEEEISDPVEDEKFHRDIAQEEQWYEIANAIGLTQEDIRATAREHGLEEPRKAIDAAEQGAGGDFPKRGSWSGELVWIFLTLVDLGILDRAGNLIKKVKK